MRPMVTPLATVRSDSSDALRDQVKVERGEVYEAKNIRGQMRTMVRFSTGILLAGAVGLGACGSEAPMSPTVSGGQAQAVKQDKVWLRGANGQAVSSVLLGVQSFRVTGGELGVPLGTAPGELGIDLARTDQAFLVGSFDLPQAAAGVDVTVRIDDFGGVESKTGNTALDTRGTPITFHVDGAEMARSHQATVIVDLARSLVPMDRETTALLPQLTVEY